MVAKSASAVKAELELAESELTELNYLATNVTENNPIHLGQLIQNVRVATRVAKRAIHDAQDYVTSSRRRKAKREGVNPLS